jgi:hypothetical protein
MPLTGLQFMPSADTHAGKRRRREEEGGLGPGGMCPLHLTCTTIPKTPVRLLYISSHGLRAARQNRLRTTLYAAPVLTALRYSTTPGATFARVQLRFKPAGTADFRLPRGAERPGH